MTPHDARLPEAARALALLATAEGTPASPERVLRALHWFDRWERMLRSQDRYRRAIHEAAHAVIGRLVAATVSSVTIAPELPADNPVGSLGRCRFDSLEDFAPVGAQQHERERLLAERWLLILAAGDAAEELAGYPTSEERQFGQEVSLGALILLYVDPRMSDEERRAFVAWIHAGARRRITEAWPWICRVREALLAHETIAGDVVDALRHPSPEPLRGGDGDSTRGTTPPHEGEHPDVS